MYFEVTPVSCCGSLVCRKWAVTQFCLSYLLNRTELFVSVPVGWLWLLSVLGQELHLLLILPCTGAGGSWGVGPWSPLSGGGWCCKGHLCSLCPAAEGAPWLMGHIVHDSRESCPTVFVMNCSLPSVCMHQWFKNFRQKLVAKLSPSKSCFLYIKKLNHRNTIRSISVRFMLCISKAVP